MLKDDVKGAFRHHMTNAEHVYRMAALIPELGILFVDLAAQFAWSRLPPYCGAFKRAISWMVAQNSPGSVS